MAEHREVPYEKPGPPKGHAYGMAAVTQALEGTDFPASKQDLMNRAGDKDVEIEKGKPVKLRSILEKMPDRQYNSMADVVSEAQGQVEAA